MQYILTEEEYKTLKSKQNYEIELSKKKLQTLCTKIANEMPVVVRRWDSPDPKPWGCKITIEENSEYGNDEWYCDKCPVQEICPSDNKEWSK